MALLRQNSDPVILQVRPLRFEFRSVDAIRFPAGKAANMFRGAFGEIFRRIACNPECPGAKSCPHAADCAYARMFEPRSAPGNGSPSGFGDMPRPFVLRAASLDGKSFETGERFTLDINVFDPELEAFDYFRQSFAQLFGEGIGPGRPLIQLVGAHELPIVGVDLSPLNEPISKIMVTFVTPTELKSGGQILRDAPFEALFKRARDRVSGLLTLYQANSLTGLVDFQRMGERSRNIRLTASRLEQHEYQRRSARTGQRHGLGGFTGEAEYEGDLAEFLPYLEAVWWTGVGRLTVWGNGMLRVAK